MFPFFEIFGSGVFIYTFGLTITFCFFLFLWMLKKLSNRFGINFTFFTNRVLWFFLSTLFFSRLFYVISNWDDSKFIKEPLEFFITSDYNLSILGALFGFFVVLFINLKLHKIRAGKYIDTVVLSLFFVLIFGYFGAFLGGQVYGTNTDFGIELLYTHPFTPVKYQVPIFPLGIAYSIIFFLIFSILYMIGMFIKIRGIIGYIGLILFSCTIILLEFLSGDLDYFKITFGYNFNQIFSFVFILTGFTGLFRLYKE